MNLTLGAQSIWFRLVMPEGFSAGANLFFGYPTPRSFTAGHNVTEYFHFTSYTRPAWSSIAKQRATLLISNGTSHASMFLETIVHKLVQATCDVVPCYIGLI